MQKRTLRRGTAAIAVALAAALTVPVPTAVADDGAVDAGIFVDKVDGLSPDFLRGVDVSTVLSLEESGVVFRDAAGQPADLFTVLADNGVNSVRIRVWNDPFDATGRGYGGGSVDVDRAVEIGELATAAGMGVLVDFHYSDFWVDPAKQILPKAWKDLSVNALDESIKLYTENTGPALRQFACESSQQSVRIRRIHIRIGLLHPLG